MKTCSFLKMGKTRSCRGSLIESASMVIPSKKATPRSASTKHSCQGILVFIVLPNLQERGRMKEMEAESGLSGLKFAIVVHPELHWRHEAPVLVETKGACHSLPVRGADGC